MRKPKQHDESREDASLRQLSAEQHASGGAHEERADRIGRQQPEPSSGVQQPENREQVLDQRLRSKLRKTYVRLSCLGATQ